MLYRVLEQHYGDRQYWAGETREVSEIDAGGLVAAGLIAKMEDEPKNKMTTPPKNKAKNADA